MTATGTPRAHTRGPTGSGEPGAPVRDTEVRGHVKERVRYALWGKSAGRCTLCNQRLLGEDLTYWRFINAAEVAHIRGATATAGSPRGLVEGESDDLDREAEENLLLCCHACHKLIDDKDYVEHFTAAKLREIKAAHEKRRDGDC
jgi:hypothetical protein